MSASPVRVGETPVLPNIACCALLALSLLLSSAASVAQDPNTGPATSATTPRVVPRGGQIQLFPCSQCHQFLESNPEIRTLAAPHVAELDHGAGRIWCLNCHNGADRDQLVTLLGEPASLEEAPSVCAGCHARRHQDWRFGAHGKRAANWQGERLVYSCTHCHDPHAPAIAPRAPQPPPPVRKGLTRQQGSPEIHGPSWERAQSKREP